MPDNPDYSKYLGGSARFSLQDMGELAARLGSPSVYDRRGEILWVDTIKHGLTSWVTAGDGTGNSVVVSADNPHLGNFAILLTAGSSSARYAYISHTIGLFESNRVGLEFSWYHDTNVSKVEVYIYALNQGVQTNALINHDLVNNITQYKNASGVMVSLGATVLSASSIARYRNTKVVIDLLKNTYERVLVDTYHFDNLNLPVFLSANSAEDYLIIQIIAYSKAGVNGKVRIGQVIITGNEP